LSNKKNENECVKDVDVTDTPEALEDLPHMEGDGRTTRGEKDEWCNDMLYCTKETLVSRRSLKLPSTSSVAPTVSDSSKGKTSILFFIKHL
jgi:hypothetical protein